VLRGLSQFKYVAWVTVGCAWVITPPFTYLLGVRWGWGVTGAWLVLCAEVSLGVTLLGLRVGRSLYSLPVVR
jgi:Na+-driven multidrug efflux pump